MLRTLLTSSPTRGKHRISRHKIQLLLPVLQKESCNNMPAVLRRQRCSALRNATHDEWYDDDKEGEKR